ncbi:alpha/beta hydrolase [Nocardia sp. NPDC051463]|uniref:alpha/beta hydrolase n=1 Tax=Nocardia sp. NPDC051463 TaxID=3154845 RepID=UPI0034297F8A
MGDYLTGHPDDDPLVAPLLADLTSLPPVLVQAGTGDNHLTDAHQLVDHARAHGVSISLELYPVATHNFRIFWSFLPEAADALRVAGRFIRDHTTGSRSEVRPSAERGESGRTCLRGTGWEGIAAQAYSEAHQRGSRVRRIEIRDMGDAAKSAHGAYSEAAEVNSMLIRGNS